MKAGLNLKFEKDTLSLDTVITAQPSNTYVVQLHNPNTTGVNISSISLEKGNNSVFRINADGQFLKDGIGHDFQIKSKDSLRIFVEATLPPNQSDQAKLVEDRLIVQLQNGERQSLVLRAYGQDVVPLKAQTITSDMLLDAKRPYQVFDSLVVAEGVTLRISPGVRLLFQARASLIVRGRIEANGTLQEPIVFRGDRLGLMFSNQPYDRIPNQWGGVLIAPNSFENQMNYCDIHSGAYGVECAASDTTRTKLHIQNSVIHNTKGHGLKTTMSRILVGNTQISNAGLDCINILGGSGEFVHCTIGQFYYFVNGDGVALRFANVDGNRSYPLSRLYFANCIITGRNQDDVVGSTDKTIGGIFNYFFRNCLLNTTIDSQDARLSNCISESSSSAEVRKDKNFLPNFDYNKLLFSFQLNPKSAATGKGDATITANTYATDRNGKARLADGASDMGCYEAIQTQ